MPIEVDEGPGHEIVLLQSDDLASPDKTRTRPALNNAQHHLFQIRRPRLWAAAAFLVIGITCISQSFGSSGVTSWSGWPQWMGCAPDRSAPAPSASASISSGDLYLLGTGKADITGPVVEINLMGYADPKQVGTGLRQRLYSRAFIVGSVSNPLDRFVYIVLDTQSGDTAVRYGILDRLTSIPEYAALYGHHNVAVTGTHSHSGPGGWLNYLLPQITSKGFDHQGFHAIVEGAALSIQRAHESLQPGYLDVSSAKVKDGNINRSLFAYLANPEEERAQYNSSATESTDDGSVDKDLTLLNFRRASDKKSIGVLTWFPTHGTSMLGNNTLITGDNKGVAAYLFEKSVRDSTFATDIAVNDGSFVAGFSQANVGDTSPNVLGAWCEDGTGLPCSFENSTCSGGKAQTCHARGPLFRQDNTGTASCFEIGRRQYEAARSAFSDSKTTEIAVRGDWVKSFHNFHNMANFTFALPNGTVVDTCPAALGYSFAAGTSDGPGAVNFTQHDSDPSNTSPVWKAVSHLLKSPSEKQRACHGAKPILLDVGELATPYQWTPNVVDIQVFRVGQFAIVVSPGEASTMAGRRWKQAVHDGLASLESSPLAPSPIVVLGGPANSYTHYITTEEEYAIQRYEGASTLYGPHTLAAYINVTLQYLPWLSAASEGTPTLPPPPIGSLPPDNSNRSLSFITGVVYDGTPLFKHFGDVMQDVDEVYSRGAQVSATFIGANPRNNLHLEGTFAAVEQLTDEESAKWEIVRTDEDWSLVYHWRRISGVLATSEVEIVWETESWAAPGRYRIRYYGDSKSLGGTITAFEGVTKAFHLE
ncbi:neutral ceramidase [Ophiostoma piceae UAMH 11346]|uniref:Neutral ceramidase n=1 Tax=Ophiostoma piceae (strain UAMH 11346) TaxID=1262450 RepID=S3CR33_OPHP1|nr:neutral ceramidase [Ophiostoma piceae UAMH 11346]